MTRRAHRHAPAADGPRAVERGFTLLEVMIAMALLVVALAALLGHEGVAVQMSHYSNRASQAALLAQGKLLDIEHALKRDDMASFDDCESGDFVAEGFREFRWKACGYKVEFPDGAEEALMEELMAMVTGLGIPGLSGEAEGGDAGGVNTKLLSQVGMAAGFVPTFIKQLEDKVRKVKLEVTWKDPVAERILLVERFVTTLGADPTNEPPPPDGEAPPPDVP